MIEIAQKVLIEQPFKTSLESKQWQRNMIEGFNGEQ